MKYHHVFEIAFSVECSTNNPDDITNDMFHQALSKRSQDLTRNNEWREAVGDPVDIHEDMT